MLHTPFCTKCIWLHTSLKCSPLLNSECSKHLQSPFLTYAIQGINHLRKNIYWITVATKPRCTLLENKCSSGEISWSSCFQSATATRCLQNVTLRFLLLSCSGWLHFPAAAKLGYCIHCSPTENSTNRRWSGKIIAKEKKNNFLNSIQTALKKWKK